MYRWLATGIAFLLLSAGCAKVVVVRVEKTDGKKLKADGVFYALPRTVARLQLKIDRTEKTPAPYAMFAEIFAPDAPRACSEIAACRPNAEGELKSPVAYSLQQGATFSTFGEPDPANVFMVTFSYSPVVDQAVSMTWNEAGLPSAASASVTNRTIDIAVSVVKLAAGLGTKAALGAVAAKPDDEPPACSPTTNNAVKTNDHWIIAAIWARKTDPFSDQVKRGLVANYCDMKATVREQFDSKTDTGLLERALQGYADRVLPYLNARSKFLTNPGNILDPAALVTKQEAVIDQQLKALFVGTKETKTWDGSYDIRVLTPAVAVLIVGLDKEQGLCEAVREEGKEIGELAPDAKPLPDGFRSSGQPCPTTTPKIAVTLQYYPAQASQLFKRVDDDVTVEAANNVTAKSKEERSFRYRIPAQVRAAVKIGEAEYGSGIFGVAQLGPIVSLPARRNARMLSYDLGFIEATGGLKTFKLGSTGGLDAATIDALGGVGTSVLDARTAARKAAEERRKAEAAAADELTILTRQQSLLKLKDEICEIQKKYGLACTILP